MDKISFKGSETIFLEVCGMALDNCEAHLAAFAAISPAYTTAFITQQRAAVAAAAAMPTEEARKFMHAEVRFQLTAANKELLFKFQTLMDRIDIAWPVEEAPSAKLAAGEAHYLKAASNQWASTVSLANAATSFIALHLDRLLANNNMAPDFPDQFADAVADFRALNKEFSKMKQAAKDSTTDIHDALNELVLMLRKLLKTGKKVANGDPELKKLFTYTYLLRQTQGPKHAGIKGKVTDALNNYTVPGVLVQVELIDRSTTTDASGKYLIHLPSGFYRVRFSAPGFEELVIENEEVRVDIITRLNVSLAPAPVELAASRAPAVTPAVPAASTAPAQELEVHFNGKEHSQNGTAVAV